MYTGSNNTERSSNVGMNYEEIPVGILAILLTLSYLTVIMETPNRRLERKSHDHRWWIRLSCEPLQTLAKI